MFKYDGPPEPESNKEIIEIQNRLKADDRRMRNEMIITMPIAILAWGLFVVMILY